MKIQFALLLAILILSCNSDDSQTGNAINSSCCSNEPVVQQIGNSKIYVPNVFTPNFDGINDLFHPILSDDFKQVDKFEIRSSAGNVVFIAENYDPNITFHFWDGMVNGEVQKGIYIYSIQLVNMDDLGIEVTGRVCNFPCGVDDPKESAFPDLDNCRTASQGSFDGQLDVTLPTGEEWPCIE